MLTLTQSDGQESQDVLLTAKANGVGTQVVTVPAGTFTAQVVRQDIAETAGSLRNEIFVTYYLVESVGTVKAVATIKAPGVGPGDTAVSVQELQSVTKR